MMSAETIAVLGVLSGVVGLTLWGIAITDDLYRMRFQRTRRSHIYDRISRVMFGIGWIFVAGFLASLYILAHNAGVF